MLWSKINSMRTYLRYFVPYLILLLDVAPVCAGEAVEAKRKFVLNALRQELEIPQKGEVRITIDEVPLDTADVLKKLGRSGPKAEEPPRTVNIHYVFDFSSAGLGKLRIDTIIGNRTIKFIRTPEFSVSKVWIDNRTSHVVTKQLPDARHDNMGAFDIRCIGISTMANLTSYGYSLDKVFELMESRDLVIEEEADNKWKLQWASSEAGVTQELWLDATNGMIPIRMAMFSTNFETPFSTVDTKWERQRDYLVPVECIDRSMTKELRMTLNWQLIDKLPNDSPFELDDLGIAERSMVVDQRLSQPIVEKVLNDYAKDKPAVRGRFQGWPGLLLIANLVLIMAIIIVLLMKRRMTQ